VIRVSRRRLPGPLLLACALAGCARVPAERKPLPPVAPSTQPSAAAVDLGGIQVRPMYREVLAVDLPVVTQVATAQGLDIQQAKERVAYNRGRYEASVEALLPVIAPAITFQHFDGSNQNANGTLVSTNFNNVLPAVTLQWIMNPGKAYYDIVASRRRLEASDQQERATELDTLRTSAVQYYELVLTQARVGVAQRSVAEAEEALRLTAARTRAGSGLPADEMRARAFLAGRQQDLVLAVNTLYQASLALTVTLHLDPTVTLVPATKRVERLTLVDEALQVDALLGLALEHRPDLESARTLVAAAHADEHGVMWGAFGPQLQAAYGYGGIATDGRFQETGLREQQRGTVGASFALGASTFGQMKSAGANLRSVALDAERALDHVRSQVVSAQQSSLSNAALIPIATEQVRSAEEALRLARANLEQGTLLLLDVLQAEDLVDSARLRHAEAVLRYNQSQVNLLAAVGLLEADRLSPSGSSTQPSTRPASAPDSAESPTPVR
jgi:outer membrane protein TolC